VLKANILNPDLEFIRSVKKAGGDSLSKCYQCATCSVVCTLAPKDNPFPRKQMVMTQWGLKEDVLADPAIWLCHQCNQCSTECPRGARPGDVLAALRALSFQHFAVPSFMGKALANRAALPLLLLVPALVMLGILLGASSGDIGYVFHFFGEVDYARAFPHVALDVIFVIGVLLMLGMSSIGLYRFWNSMKALHPGSGGPGFISATIATIFEIGTHDKFAKCESDKKRYYGHLLIFYGFISALIATALNFLFVVIIKFLGSPWYLTSPIEFPNPVKLFGIAGGIAMIIGGWLLIQRRISGDDEVGESTYQDWVFLIVLTSVAVTGMLAWILRILHLPILAYADYFAHLVLVFYLLWYLPYTKFGHVFYRTLALIYAKSIGTDTPRQKSA